MHLVVLHPRAGRRPRRAFGDAVRNALAADGRSVELLETRAGSDNAAILATRLARGDVRTLVAGGGDGTVRDAVEALLTLQRDRRPAFLALALGTANNVARAFGRFPKSVATAEPSVDAVVACLRRGAVRRVDAATANGRAFVGSFAAGMDADILAWRNAMAPRVPAAVAGYPLYLAACAVGATRPHGAGLRMTLDGDEVQRNRECGASQALDRRHEGEAAQRGGPDAHSVPRKAATPQGHGFNVLVTNTAIYAGEFRFAVGRRHDDGRLDVLWNRSVGDYLRCYAAAWPRHLRDAAGRRATGDPRLLSAARLTLEFDRPVRWQLDGETLGEATSFAIAVDAEALAVLEP